MADEKKRISKSESLTIRLDPKMRFVVEFVARVRGQTITTVIERALVVAAEQVTVKDEDNNYLPWQYFWDVSEGVRALQLASEPGTFPTFEEERRLAFAREHWPFFYKTSKRDEFRRPFIDVLWPRIDEFVKIRVTEKNYFAPGKAMQDVLKEANLQPPEWPVKEAKTSFGNAASSGSSFGKTASSGSKYSDLDDDIPF